MTHSHLPMKRRRVISPLLFLPLGCLWPAEPVRANCIGFPIEGFFPSLHVFSVLSIAQFQQVFDAVVFVVLDKSCCYETHPNGPAKAPALFDAGAN